MKSRGIASFSFLQLLLLSNACGAESANKNPRKLARLVLDRFAAGSKKPGFLRKLAQDTAMKQEFGPDSDWSCSAVSNGGIDFDSCTSSEASEGTEGGCSWCPLGSSMGICLRAGQASVINGLENEHLLHLKCYSDADEVIDEEATAFWDEAMACLPHHKEICGGDHGDGNHVCTYCTTTEPTMGLCLSTSLWENLVIAQAFEDFEQDVSTADQIRLDQVIHCSTDQEYHSGSGSTKWDDNIWDNPCEGPPITDDASEEECFVKEGCAVAPSIFPGFLGSEPGVHCVSIAKERATMWAATVLRETGWVKEMDAFDVF